MNSVADTHASAGSGGEVMVEVGIATSGSPRMRPAGDCTLVENVVIGLGFHWERVVECVFPGELRRLSDEEPPFTLVNRLPLERYLECVVGSEMNPLAPPEFLRAHAIVSRSWVAGKLPGMRSRIGDASGKVRSAKRVVEWEDDADHRAFHLCNDDHCQRYQGVQPISAEGMAAIRDTRGIVLRAPSGALVDARFSKCCGGMTELFSTCWQPREEECLESVEDSWCDLSALTPEERERLLSSVLKDYDRSTGGGYRWTRTVDVEGIRSRLLSGYGVDVGRIRTLTPLERGASGRIKSLKIEGEGGAVAIGKELAIRRLLAADCLYSSSFEAYPVSGGDADLPSAFRLEGRGWGHGVGLCQIGAAHMALAGHTCEEILRHYYPGSSLSLLDINC